MADCTSSQENSSAQTLAVLAVNVQTISFKQRMDKYKQIILRDSYKILVTIIVCLALSISYLFFNTSLLFEKIESKPIKVFFDENQGIILDAVYTVGNNTTLFPSKGIMQRYGVIPKVSINSENPLESGTTGFQMDFPNFNDTDFWYPNGNHETFNGTIANEYAMTHNPDFLILAPFIQEEYANVSSPVWGSIPIYVPIATNSILHQTSYGVWECEYYFNSGEEPEYAYNTTYLPANVNEIEFKIIVPKGFSVENQGAYESETINDKKIITQDLEKGNTLHVVMKDNNAIGITTITNFLNPTLIGILLGIIIEKIYNGHKTTNKRKGKNAK